MLFREHRGSLKDSMRTVVEVKSRADLNYHLLSVYFPPESFYAIDTKTLKDLKFEYLGYDERIKWDTWLVTIKGHGVLGMTNGTFDDLEDIEELKSRMKGNKINGT